MRKQAVFFLNQILFVFKPGPKTIKFRPNSDQSQADSDKFKKIWKIRQSLKNKKSDKVRQKLR